MNINPRVTREWAVPALLVAAACIAFGNGLSGGFVWDDFFTVVRNTRTHGISHLPGLLGWGDEPLRYRFLRDLSYVLDYSISGLNPFVYHVLNLVYHCVTTLLVFGLIRRVSRNRTVAMWAGLLFAVHPLQVDVVTYISGRRDVLCTLFYLASVLAYIRFRDSGRARWFVGALVAGALGLLTKELAATFPGAWFLVDLWREREQRGGPVIPGGVRVLTRHWRLYGTGLVAAAGFIAYVLLFQDVGVERAPHGGTWASNFMTEAVVLAHAVRILLLPTSLVLDYQNYFPPVQSPFEFRFLVSALLLLLLAMGGGWLARRSAAGMFAVNWAWITFIPMMQIIPHGEQFAEHYMYLPSVGLFMLAGMGLAALFDRGDRAARVGIAAAAVLVLVLGVRTWDRNRDFVDHITVLESQLRYHPYNPRALNNLAIAYRAEGRYADAAEAWKRYVVLQPDDADGWVSLATQAYRLRDLDLATKAFEVAVARDPEHESGWTGLGMARRERGDFGGAEEAFQKVVEINPGNGDGWNNLGALYALQGRWQQAKGAFYQALQVPEVPLSAYLNVARVELELDNCEGAVAALGEARAQGLAESASEAFADMAGMVVARCGPLP